MPQEIIELLFNQIEENKKDTFVRSAIVQLKILKDTNEFKSILNQLDSLKDDKIIDEILFKTKLDSEDRLIDRLLKKLSIDDKNTLIKLNLSSPIHILEKDELEIEEENGEILKFPVPDKKYFKKTYYADIFKQKFGVALENDKVQFATTFYTYHTLIKASNYLNNYQKNKKELFKKLKTLFEKYFKEIRGKIKKCYDSDCIEIFDQIELWYEELIEMEELDKFNFNGMKEEITNLSMAMMMSDLFELKNTPNRKIKFLKNYSYTVLCEDLKIIDNNQINGGKIAYFERLLTIFYKKYKQKLLLSEYIFVLDTLTMITNYHKIIFFEIDIKIIAKLKHMLNCYFDDYKEPIKINNDFDTNYTMLKIMKDNLESGKIEETKHIIETLIQKNIEFLSVEIKHMNNDTTDLLNFLNEGGTNNEKI